MNLAKLKELRVEYGKLHKFLGEEVFGLLELQSSLRNYRYFTEMLVAIYRLK